MSTNDKTIPVQDRRARRQMNSATGASSVDAKSKIVSNCISLGANKGGEGKFVFIKFNESDIKRVDKASLGTHGMSGDNIYGKVPESSYVSVEGNDKNLEEYIKKLQELIDGGTLNPSQLLTAQDLIFLHQLFLKSKEDLQNQGCKVTADEYGEGGELDTYPE